MNDASPVDGSAPRKSRWRLHFAAVAAILIVVALSGTAAWLFAVIHWPTPAEVTSKRVLVLTSADGQDLLHKGNLRLLPVEARDMPPELVNAVLSIEDRRFYSHGGYDPMSILRAARDNLQAGKVVGGGSTITQQLVKILFLTPQRTFQRKIQEAAMAIWIEHHMSKDQILTSYLNNVYLGSGATGFPAAAKLYFNKSVKDLSLPEAAMLAGAINAPGQDDPLKNPDAARRRAATVLDAMVENGKLSQDAALVAKLHPATPGRSQLSPPSAGWFVDWVYNKALPVIPPLSGAVRLRTTLDLRLQDIATNVVQQTLAKYGGDRHAGEAALVAMRPDGAVIAMVGGRSYDRSQYNRAVQAERQPGSAFKLFDYYAALRQGYSPEDRILDAPVDIRGWQPENYSRHHQGEVTLADAFANSLNDAAVRLSQQVGIGQVIAAARDLGLRAQLQNNPSLALGTSEVTLLDLTSAYAAVRAGRAPVSPYGIAAIKTQGEQNFVSMDRRSTAQHPLGQYQGQLISLLQGVVAHGTGRAAALDGFAAGKTGTAQNYRDAWFIGFNDSLVVGVWVGNDDHSPMKAVTGGTLPARIWKDFMTQAAALPAAEANAPRELTTVGQARDAFASSDQTSLPAETRSAAQCNIAACGQFYHSFRASDCTYQPYSGGPRQYCGR